MESGTSASSPGPGASVANKIKSGAKASDGAEVRSAAPSGAPNAGDGAGAGLELSLARFDALFREHRDATPREARGQARAHTRALALLDPDQKRAEMAKMEREKRAAADYRRVSDRLNATAWRHAYEAKQSLSDEIFSINQELISNRAAYIDGACADGVGSVVARQKELLARRELARTAAKMYTQDVAGRGYAKMNRARRSAILEARRRRGRAADEGEEETGTDINACADGTVRAVGDLGSDEAAQAGAREAGGDARNLAWVGSRELAEAAARTRRARLFATLLGEADAASAAGGERAGNGGSAPDDRNALQTGRTALVDVAVGARDPGGLHSTEACGREELGTSSEKRVQVPRAPAEATTREKEREDDPPWKHGEVRVKAEAIETFQEEFQTGGGGAPTTDVVGTGEAGGNSPVVDSAGAAAGGCGSPSVEARLERLRVEAVAEGVERTARDAGLRTGGRAAVDGAEIGGVRWNVSAVGDAGASGCFPLNMRKRMAGDAVKAKKNADTRHAAKSPTGGRGFVSGVGTGEPHRNAAVVDSVGTSGGFSSAEAGRGGLQAKAVDGTAAEVKRRADFARGRRENVRVSGAGLTGGAGAGGVCRSAPVVSGAGAAGGLPSVEDKLRELRAKTVTMVAGTAPRDGAEDERKAGPARVRRAQSLQRSGERSVLRGVGAGEVVFRNAAAVNGTGAAGGFPLVADRLEWLRAKALAEVAERAALDPAGAKRKAGLAPAHHVENLQTGGRGLLGGVGTGEVCRNAAIVGGTGTAGGSPVVEAGPEGLRAMAVADGRGKLARDAAEADRNADRARAGRPENVQLCERPLMNGVGTGEVRRIAAAVGGTGAAGGLPFAEARLEGVRAQAAAAWAERVARDAAEVKRKADLARARREDSLPTVGRALADGVGAGRVHRNAAVAHDPGAGGFPLGEARPEVPRATAVAEVADKADGDVADVKRRADLAWGRHADKLQISERALMRGIGTGEWDRNAGAVGGTGAVGGFMFVEARPEGLRAKAVAEEAERAARDAVEARRKADLALTSQEDNLQAGGSARMDGAPRPQELRPTIFARVAKRMARDAAETKRKAKLARVRRSEKPREGGSSLADSVGTGEAYRNAAFVDITGSGGFPFLVARPEGHRVAAIAEVAETVARDTGEVTISRRADCARSRRAGRNRRHEEKLERRASRDARRLEKLLDRERRTKVRGERLGPPVGIVKSSVRSEEDAVAEEGGGMLAREDVRRDEPVEAVSRLQGEHPSYMPEDEKGMRCFFFFFVEQALCACFFPPQHNTKLSLKYTRLFRS